MAWTVGFLRDDLTSWYVQASPAGSQQEHGTLPHGLRRLSKTADPPSRRRSLTEPFAEAMERLSAAHHTELAELQGENIALRGELTRLRGRVEELEMLQERAHAGIHRSHAVPAVGFGTPPQRRSVHEPVAEEEPIPDEPFSEEDAKANVAKVHMSVGEDHGTAQASRMRFADQQVPEVQPPDHSDCDTVTNATLRTTRTEDFVLNHWTRLVFGILQLAARELFQLQEVWKKDEAFIRRVERAWNNNAMDLLVSSDSGYPRSTRDSPRESKPGAYFLMAPNVIGVIGNGSIGGGPGGCLASIENILHQCTMDPQSPRRIGWGCFGLALVIYDLLYLPLTVFQIPSHWFPLVMSVASQLYWTADIVVIFLTGVYVDSELHYSLKTIAFSYIRSPWFPIDLSITIPLWVPIFLGDDLETTEQLRTFRFVRIIRFLRLLRLIKLTHLLSESMNLINSPAVLITIGIMKLTVGLMLTNHVVACLWYWVGDTEKGWVTEQRVGGRLEIYKYLTAMHWTITQFQGTSDILPGSSTVERLYAVSMVMFALIAFSCFVSLLTNLIMELHGLHAHRTFQQRVVRGYLSNHNISAALSIRVKKYVEWKQRMDKAREHDAAVVQMLPEQIMADLLEEVRVPIITTHRFFALFQKAYPRVVRRISAELLQAVSPAPDELVFTPYDTAPKMYWVERGKLTYTWSSMYDIQRSSREALHRTFHEEETPVTTPTCLAEPVLWTNWEHCGKLVGVSDASLLALSNEDFIRVIESYSAAHCSAVYYARRFVATLNRFGKRYTDLIDTDFWDDLIDDLEMEE